jgi:hypothetical protein
MSENTIYVAAKCGGIEEKMEEGSGGRTERTEVWGIVPMEIKMKASEDDKEEMKINICIDLVKASSCYW